MAPPPPSRPGSAAFDVEAVRRDFPILSQKIHGKPLVYLDNAATTQKPQAVIDAMVRSYAEDNANIHRGVHLLSERATQAYELAREKVQHFLNAASPREIIFVRGTTEAINLVAATYGRAHVGKGDEVLITEMEHHSNIVPWQLLCEEKGAQLTVLPITDEGELRMDLLDGLLTDRTKIVAVNHVSNSLGTINPIKTIVEKAHKRGIPVLVDGAQAVPHMPVDVQALDGDFYAFSGHKLFGPTGIGVLYGKLALLEAMPPYQGGGDMISSVTFKKTTYNVVPNKFEAGTPNIAGRGGPRRGDRLPRRSLDFARCQAPRRRAARVRHGGADLASRHPHRRNRKAENERLIVRDGQRAPARHRHHPGPGGRRDPHRAPLHAAADGADGRAGHRARLAGAVQYEAKRLTRWFAPWTRCGRFSTNGP